MTLLARIARLERHTADERALGVREFLTMPDEAAMAFLFGDETHEWRERFPHAWKLHEAMFAALWRKPSREPAAEAQAEPAPAAEVSVPADALVEAPVGPLPELKPTPRYGAARPNPESVALLEQLGRWTRV